MSLNAAQEDLECLRRLSHIISFKARAPLIGGERLEIDTVCQNRLNAIKNHEI